MESGHRILATSPRWQVESAYETVELVDRHTPASGIVIGDFYGDPESAIIDVDGSWVATAGCGLIIYFLEPPFAPYEYYAVSRQWVEAGRHPPDIWWITSLRQSGPSEIVATLDEGGELVVRFGGDGRRLEQG